MTQKDLIAFCCACVVCLVWQCPLHHTCEIPKDFLEIWTKQTECDNAINELLTSQGEKNNQYEEGQSSNLGNLDLPNYIIIRTRCFSLAPSTTLRFYDPLFFCLYFNLELVKDSSEVSSKQWTLQSAAVSCVVMIFNKISIIMPWQDQISGQNDAFLGGMISEDQNKNMLGNIKCWIWNAVVFLPCGLWHSTALNLSGFFSLIW